MHDFLACLMKIQALLMVLNNNSKKQVYNPVKVFRSIFLIYGQQVEHVYYSFMNIWYYFLLNN